MAENIYLAVVLAFAIWSFWSQRLRTDVTAMLVLLSLILPWPHPDGQWSAVLTPEQGFSGFGSSAVVMIASMFVLAGAIVQTGAAEAIGMKLLRRVADSEWRLQLAVLLFATLSSMFINDTTVVMILMPLVVSICKEKKLSPSRYLMFAAYGSLLGGQWTLIGTRSNIIISDYLRQETGEGIGFFAFTPLAAVVFVFSAVVMMFLARKILPSSNTALSGELMKEFLTEVDVPEDSPAIGSRLYEVEAFQRDRLAAIAILRNSKRVPVTVQLRGNDVIIVRGTVERIAELIKSSDFRVVEETKLNVETLESADLKTVEAVLPLHSRYAGYMVRQLPFSRAYDVTVIGMSRHGKQLKAPLNETRLEFGDSLLFLGSAEDIARLRENQDFLALEEQSFPAIGRRKAWLVLSLLVSVIVLAVTGLLAPNISIPAAAMAAVMLGGISWRGAYEAIDWPTLILLGGMISFGHALDETGAAAQIATLTVDVFSGVSPVILLGGILLVAIIFTQIIENAAVAIIVAPIAYQVAQATGMDVYPIMVALAVCISAGFSTPVSHESTILVMGPGQYEFKHYFLIGGVLAIITWVVSTLVAPLLWNIA